MFFIVLAVIPQLAKLNWFVESNKFISEALHENSRWQYYGLLCIV